MAGASTASPAAATEHREPALSRWVGWLSEASGIVAALAMVAATFVTAYGVFVRYVLKQPTVWQTETTIYLLMLVTFVGAAYGLKHHAHVGVDLLVERLSTRGQLVMRTITGILALGVVLVVLWTSFQMWQEAYLMDHRSSTAARFPLWIPYAFLPLGMFLVALQYVAMIAEAIAGLTGRIPADRVALMGATSELAHVQAEIEAIDTEHHDHPEDSSVTSTPERPAADGKDPR